MKRIGVLLAIEPTWGGAFQYDQAILDALAGLPTDRYEVVVGYAHRSWLPYLERYRFKNVPIPLGYWDWGRVLGQLLHYSCIGTGVWRAVAPILHPTARALVREGCDLWIFPSQDPWSYLTPVPALATIHDLMHRYERRFPEVGNPKEFSWREWHYRNTCRWCRGVLVDSSIGKQHVVESYGLAASRVHVLPFIAPGYLEEDGGGDAYPFPLPEKFLFYPAQFWAHKNHEGLIRAIASLKPRFPEIKLVLAGAKKRGYAQLSALVGRLGLTEDVLFLGYVPDSQMMDLYKRARGMIMASFCGPTNIPPLEAMKTGCPAAVSDVYGMPEQTRGAALLFDPASVESMASAMASLWEDDALCRELAERGMRVSAEWTKEHFNDRLAGILAEALKLRSGD
ncbi:glycosyltransferase family 1 protein [Geomonas sp.]|uniref:glycosyltransferase family 4 protein n=1 Tax=Geomonas sp. TaxID=2651584 RepID=UPI002B49EB6D|nr:glycosyltransferase family 1 protein [Geomonas sp.]HJV35779.1 glycosyltransferase family 1 protein [Geomonas sp.]